VDLFKNSSEIITPKLYILFNSIMNCGILSNCSLNFSMRVLLRGQKINMFTNNSKQALEKDIAQLITFVINLLRVANIYLKRRVVFMLVAKFSSRF